MSRIQLATRPRRVASSVPERRPDGGALACAMACAALALCGTRVGAQACERTESRTNLAALAGQRIRSIDVRTGGPADHGLAGLVAKLHMTTRASAVQNRVLVHVGEPLDSARLGESLRRLRRLRFLDDVSAIAERCEGVDGVALTIATRDAWSTAPELRLASAPPPGAEEARPAGGLRVPNGLLGLEERNFLGTGREVRGGVETRDGRLGGSVSFTDPLVMGMPIVGKFRIARLPNERGMSATLRSDERDAPLPWRGLLALTQSARWPLQVNAGRFNRSALQALGGRRITIEDAPSATYLTGGVEMSHAELTRFDGVRTPGPGQVSRRFAGVDFGVERVARRYAANTWLLPHDDVFDVPRGLEYSAVLGLGGESTTDHAAAHVDGWIGRIWQPGTRTLLTTDLWTSGYMVGSRTSAGVLRTSVSTVHRASHGTWTARVVGERLTRPDPDVRTLLGLDPTAMMFDQKARLAAGTLAASIERTVRMEMPMGHAAFDLASFAAGSVRQASCGDGPADLAAAAVGIGLRAAPASASRSALRLDLLVPVGGLPGAQHRPYVTLTFAPGIAADRVRDAMRSR